MTAFYPGHHALLDLYGCNAQHLANPDLIEGLMRQSAHAVQAQVLGAHVHHFGEGLGVTGVLLLAESHLSIHTWPEHGFAAVDVFLCGERHPENLRMLWTNGLIAARTQWRQLARGAQLSCFQAA